MSKLIMWNLLSLDGYFEGVKSWELGWHPYIWGDELERFSLEQLRTADRLLFGRVTYEGMAAYWVFSNARFLSYARQPRGATTIPKR